jgi:hypothetical protein
MPARHPSVAVLWSWLATVAVVATAAVASQAPPTEPDAVVRTAAPRATTTTVPPTTTTLPPATTTTAPPPPPTTAPPAPRVTAAPRPVVTIAPPTTVAPPPPPASVVNEPAPAASAEYAMSLIGQVVPARWLAAVPVRFQVIPGNTSWSSWGGLIEVGEWHLTSSVARAKNVLTHEWGHQVAWLYGTDAYNGAPPAGFPHSGSNTEEQWADCVAEALTGTSYPTGGLGRCPGDALAFTAAFFARAPGPRLRGG